MDKIFLFIIIMIISSLISKNKKKKADQARIQQYKQNTATKAKPEPDRNSGNGAASQLKDLLSRYGALNDAERHAEQNKTNVQYDVYSEKPYEDRHHQQEVERENYEEYSESREKFPDEHVIDLEYKEKYESSIGNTSRIKVEHDWNSKTEVKKPRIKLSEVFGSKKKLRNSIIASEVLSRKYC